jgi:hypothetical protein
LSVVDKILLQDKSKLEAEIVRAVGELNCKASPCIVKSEMFSQIIDTILKTGPVDHASRLDMMDPQYEEKLNRAETK